MTDPPAQRELWRVFVTVLAAAVLAGTFLWQDRSSLERGNRLYRDNQIQTAESLYRATAESRSPRPTAFYNLGTALLTLGIPESERYLQVAAAAADSAAAQRGNYNLGYRLLTRLEESGDPASWVPLLAAAVGSNRAALRLDPSDEDARWNLALAQRLFEDMTALMELEEDSVVVEELPTPEEEEGGIVIPQIAQDRTGMVESGREALAGEDPGELTEGETLDLIETIRDNPEKLLWGILWSRRPDVASWLGSYPGGRW